MGYTYTYTGLNLATLEAGHVIGIYVGNFTIPLKYNVWGVGIVMFQSNNRCAQLVGIFQHWGRGQTPGYFRAYFT
jgi:hypothetical protein